MAKPVRPDPDLEAEFSPYRLQDRPSPRPEIPESLQRPPRDDSAGDKRIKPKSAIAFGSKKDRFGTKSRKGGPGMRASAAERMAEQQHKQEAEKAKEINANFKKFLEAISNALKKNEEDLLADDLPNYTVREAKNDAEH